MKTMRIPLFNLLLAVGFIAFAMIVTTPAHAENGPEPCIEDFMCGNELDDRVFVCHAPPGNPDIARTLCVDAEDSVDHQEHGDECGECVDDCGPPFANDCGDGCCDPREDNPRNTKWYCQVDCDPS